MKKKSFTPAAEISVLVEIKNNIARKQEKRASHSKIDVKSPMIVFYHLSPTTQRAECARRCSSRSNEIAMQTTFARIRIHGRLSSNVYLFYNVNSALFTNRHVYNFIIGRVRNNIITIVYWLYSPSVYYWLFTSARLCYLVLSFMRIRIPRASCAPQRDERWVWIYYNESRSRWIYK